MKKLITGAVAALALLFGFASCSGDLHDSVVSNLYAEGDFCTEKVGNNNVRLPFVMTKGSDTEQKYEFKYDENRLFTCDKTDFSQAILNILDNSIFALINNKNINERIIADNYKLSECT